MDMLPLFFAVSLVATATPGPAVFYVTSQGVSGGMRSALSSGFGILAADAFYILLSITGLTAILVASYELFTVMRWAGAIYLVYLGIRVFWGAVTAAPEIGANSRPATTSRKSFAGGFILHAANPKALLYFGSVVPQFVDAASPLGPQLTVLACIHLATASFVLLAYGAVAAKLRRSAAGARFRRVFHASAGAVLVGTGISLALAHKE